MSTKYTFLIAISFFLGGRELSAQTVFKGKVIDAITHEAISGATIQCADSFCHLACVAKADGSFEMNCTTCNHLSISAMGYQKSDVPLSSSTQLIAMTPATSILQEVVVSASRGEQVKRSEAPIAVSVINSKTLQDAKATTADQVLNKVSGVNMVNLGNEQHEMSIRQPMTTKSLFLYLEDGIPIRTTGLYNHNALLEMNMAATKSIEVIKGPSSSLYGSEAIGGVVNFITAAPSAVPVLRVSAQGNDIGYRRADLMSSVSSKRWGFVLSGYYAARKDGFLEYTDFHKAVMTARVDYKISNRTNLSNSLTWLTYYSDMAGGIDSTMFANRSFRNLQTFTYRKVDALRYRSTLNTKWNDKSKTSLSVLYRKNTIGQNPAYRVKDDYRKINGVFSGRKDVAHGEINASSFHSYALIAQHRQKLHWKDAAVTGGLNVDLSPSDYDATYIRIKKDSVNKKYLSYQKGDSILTNYSTALNNYAGFASFEMTATKKLRLVASLRYDLFTYRFDNHLKPSAFSGSPDTVNHFERVSPKIGFTYNFSARTGLYANYSEGFVPPQVTELYTGVKVPSIQPSVFYNYEAGGWVELLPKKLSADLSVYRLTGTNEIISVKLDDGSFANQNAGKTNHRGIELGVNATPVDMITFRFSGAWSRHEFERYTEKGVKYDGNQMNNAPNWIYNAEVWVRPVKGVRVGAEYQHVGSYFVDPQNTARYDGYNVLNLRAGYRRKGVEIWLNVLNATDAYFSYITTRSASGYSYQLGEPRNFNLGFSYDLASLFKN